uniref:Uncharacterized protein n=1 Tax=Thermodesulfobacterium geofontis TaxID=1295609 RepID=A0A7V4JPJ2_9BACT
MAGGSLTSEESCGNIYRGRQRNCGYYYKSLLWRVEVNMRITYEPKYDLLYIKLREAKMFFFTTS